MKSHLFRLFLTALLLSAFFASPPFAQVYEFSKPNVPVNDDSLGRHLHYPTSAGMHGLAARGDTLYATWHDNRDGNYKVYFSKSTNGGILWSPNVIVNDTASATHIGSTIALGYSGEIYICWRDNREGLTVDRIYCSKSTDGGATWGRNVPVSQTCWGGLLSSICTDRLGRVFITWGADSSGYSPPYFSKSTDGGLSFGPIYLVADSVRVDPQGYPSIGVDDSGLVYIAFASHRPTIGGPSVIWAARSTDPADTSFFPLVVVSDSPPTGLYLYRSDPSLFVKPDGEVHVAWKSDDVDTFVYHQDIFYAKSTDRGRSFSSRVRVTDYQWPNLIDEVSYPSIAADTGRGVYITWPDTRWGSWHGFFAVSTDGGGSFGPNVLIEDTTDGIPNAVRAHLNVAVNTKTKTAYVIWADERFSRYAGDIYSARGVLSSGVADYSSHSLFASRSHLRIQPNPFSSFTTIHGHEKESFTLYDISGRKVGIYKGDKIGWDVSPGVYFLRSEKGDPRPVRIVKLR
jgi:hypothetical protein